MTREEMLHALDRAEADVTNFQNAYLSRGTVGKILFGLKTHGYKYAVYLLARSGLFGDWSVSVETFWGDVMRVPLRDEDAFSPYLFGILGGPESRLIRYLAQTADAKTIFYDIGASYGYYSLLLSAISGSGRIFSFEPNHRTLAYTRTALSKHSDQITLVESAVGDRIGTVSFYDKSVGRHSGGSTTVAGVAAVDEAKFKKETVAMTTLDAFCIEHPQPNIIKIDVEGGEASVIQGATEMIGRARPIIAMEVWGNAMGRQFSEPSVTHLLALGYRCHRIEPTGELHPIASIDFENDLGRDNYDNFVFLPPTATPVGF